MSNLDEGLSSCNCQDEPCAELAALIQPREKDLGGFQVRRCLPAAQQQMVGPFIFFDHLGPVEFPAGQGIDVRPHPHINLATVTYLFEGEILHRDSLGNVQPIRPGEINWMTAGKGIVHSERTPPERRQGSHRLHALQLWVALPAGQEEVAADFRNYSAAELPQREENGVAVRVMVGSAYGLSSPVVTLAKTLYVDISLAAGTALALPEDVDELGIYLVSGAVSLGGHKLAAQSMAIPKRGQLLQLSASADSRLVMIGGESLGERHIWWNFVSSRQQRIEQAKQDWQEKRFAKVPDEHEFIPLPE